MQGKRSKRIEDFLNFLRDAQNEYDWSMEQEKKQDDLTQDILHSLELDELPYHERARLAGYLAETRKERRRCKDAKEELEEVVRFARENAKAINLLGQVLGAVRKQEKYHGNRSYHPKVMSVEEMVKTKGTNRKGE